MADSAIQRHRTAIQRGALSRPTACAIRDGLITPATTVLDFGCGHGGDTQRMRAVGIPAAGWDRHFAPHQQIDAAAVVLLNYVLNTIEDAPERKTTLLFSYGLTRSVLVAAVRTDKADWKGKVRRYSDGVITAADTFQKIYNQAEFCQSVANILQTPVHEVAAGIAYIFRDKGVEQHYLARHPRRYRSQWLPESSDS